MHNEGRKGRCCCFLSGGFLSGGLLEDLGEAGGRVASMSEQGAGPGAL